MTITERIIRGITALGILAISFYMIAHDKISGIGWVLFIFIIPTVIVYLVADKDISKGE